MAEEISGSIGSPISALHYAATSESKAAFAKAIANITVWQSAEQIKDAIELALKIDCYAIASELAQKAFALYPNDDQLQKYARVLAPPKVTQTGVPAVKGLAESMQWLKEYGAEYRGQWVAIQNGEILAYASTKADLTKALGDNISAKEGVIITKIPAFEVKF